MPGRGMPRGGGGGYVGYGGGYPMHAGNENRGRKVDFSRLHRDNFGYYNICFQKPEGNFNIQEAKTVFEEYGKVPVVHAAAKTVFIRFEERDAAEAALLALMDTDQFERLTIPAQRPFSSAGGGGKDEQDVVVRNLPETVTEDEVRNMVNDYNPLKVSLQVKEDRTEAMVRFPNEEKAKEFIGTLEGGDVVAKLLPSRKKKVEPMGGGYMDEGPYYDAAGNFIQPLESDPRVVELWVGNYPKETTKEELEDWFKKYGGTTYITMKEKKDKNWGFAFVGVKSANQAQRATRELHQKKVGAFNIAVRLSQSEQMIAPVAQGYDGYGGYGDGNGAAYGGGVSEMQQYEENIKELRRNNKLQRASHLARSAEFMLNEVLDDCPHCGSVANVMKELCSVLDSLLPPGSVPPSQADMQAMVGGSPRKPNVMGSPRGAGMSPSEPKSGQRISLQDELNQLNPNRSKQPGAFPHGGHGQGRGHHPKHVMFSP